jgi:hypothetical protein
MFFTEEALGLILEMGSTSRSVMHNPQGCAVFYTYYNFMVSCFQVLYSITHVIIKGLYIGIINF